MTSEPRVTSVPKRTDRSTAQLSPRGLQTGRGCPDGSQSASEQLKSLWGKSSGGSRDAVAGHLQGYRMARLEVCFRCRQWKDQWVEKPQDNRLQ